MRKMVDLWQTGNFSFHWYAVFMERLTSGRSAAGVLGSRDGALLCERFAMVAE